MTEHRRPLGAPPPEDLAPPWTAIIWLPGGCRYHVLSAHRSYAQAIGAAAQTTGAQILFRAPAPVPMMEC